MTNRTYTTGEKPENPVLHEKYVFIISDIRQEPTNPEYPEMITWSYTIDEQLTYPEYIQRMRSESEAARQVNDAALLELDADICTLYDLVGGGSV